MTETRKAELRAEVDRIRQAGHDPANMARARLLEIVDELLSADLDQGEASECERKNIGFDQWLDCRPEHVRFAEWVNIWHGSLQNED